MERRDSSGANRYQHPACPQLRRAPQNTSWGTNMLRLTAARRQSKTSTWKTEIEGLPENHDNVRSARRRSLPLKENSKRKLRARTNCRAACRKPKRKQPTRLERLERHHVGPEGLGRSRAAARRAANLARRKPRPPKAYLIKTRKGPISAQLIP